MFEMIVIVCGMAYGVEHCEHDKIGPFENKETCEVSRPLIASLFKQELNKNGITGVRSLSVCGAKSEMI